MSLDFEFRLGWLREREQHERQSSQCRKRCCGGSTLKRVEEKFPKRRGPEGDGTAYVLIQRSFGGAPSTYGPELGGRCLQGWASMLAKRKRSTLIRG